VSRRRHTRKNLAPFLLAAGLASGVLGPLGVTLAHAAQGAPGPVEATSAAPPASPRSVTQDDPDEAADDSKVVGHDVDVPASGTRPDRRPDAPVVDAGMPFGDSPGPNAAPVWATDAEKAQVVTAQSAAAAVPPPATVPVGSRGFPDIDRAEAKATALANAASVAAGMEPSAGRTSGASVPKMDREVAADTPASAPGMKQGSAEAPARVSPAAAQREKPAVKKTGQAADHLAPSYAPPRPASEGTDQSYAPDYGAPAQPQAAPALGLGSLLGSLLGVGI